MNHKLILGFLLATSITFAVAIPLSLRYPRIWRTPAWLGPGYFALNEGRFHVETNTYNLLDQKPPDCNLTDWYYRDREPFQVLGFMVFMQTRGFGVRASLTIPLWMPAFILAAYPLDFARRRLVRRWRFARRGACRLCGYDLTGNVTGTCTECGATVRITRRRRWLLLPIVALRLAPLFTMLGIAYAAWRSIRS